MDQTTRKPPSELLTTMYIIEDWAQISSFLESHPYLASLLLELHHKVSDYFPSPQIHLELEPDFDEDGGRLAASIATAQDVDAALASLQCFDDNWWLANLDRAQHRLGVHIEFV